MSSDSQHQVFSSHHTTTMSNKRRISRITLLFIGALLMGAGCHSFGHEMSKDLHIIPSEDARSSISTSSTIPLQRYTNKNLGISMEIPETVIVSNCVPKTIDGQSYVDVIGNHATAPLQIKEIPQGAIFYPEWSMEPYDIVHIKTASDDFDAYTHCKRTPVPQNQLTQRDGNRNYPYWTILIDSATSESEIRSSVTRRCYNKLSDMTVYAGLATTTEPGVFDIHLDIDRRKTNDTSLLNCPDLVYAKYASTTHQIYYLFNNGFYSIDDPTHQLIQDNLFKAMIANQKMATSTAH